VTDPPSLVPPQVSVVIPAYRASGDIAVALQSVARQRYGRLETIVVNDGSPDSDALDAAIEPFRAAIHYVAQDNRGAAAARNVGVALARGRWIAFLDADDCWTPDYLPRQLGYLDRHPAIDLVYADALVSGESPLAGRRFTRNAPSRGEVTLDALVAQQCNVLLSTVVVRRAVLIEAGGFDETIRRGHDFDLWLRLALNGVRMAYQPIVVAERRVRAAGLSGDAVAELERAREALERFGARHALPERTRSLLGKRTSQLADRLAIERAKCRLADGDFAAARLQLDVATQRPLKVRLAALGLRFAPELVRRMYVGAR